MSVELAKRLASIARQSDVAALQQIATELAKSLHQATTRSTSPDNYSVTVNGAELATGSRDFCVGYATAANDRGSDCKVMCGSVEVWPEWGGGLENEGGDS